VHSLSAQKQKSQFNAPQAKQDYGPLAQPVNPQIQQPIEYPKVELAVPLPPANRTVLKPNQPQKI